MLNVVGLILLIVVGIIAVVKKQTIVLKFTNQLEQGLFFVLISFVAIAYAILIGYVFAMLSRFLLNILSDVSNLLGLVLILIPFLLVLLVYYFFCNTYFRQVALQLPLVNNGNLGLQSFSNILLFLNAVIIAFCLFLKSSIYSLLAISDIRQFSFDIVIGLIISLLTALSLSVNKANEVWNIRYQKRQQKLNTAKHYKDSYIRSKIYCHNQIRYNTKYKLNNHRKKQ